MVVVGGPVRHHGERDEQGRRYLERGRGLSFELAGVAGRAFKGFDWSVLAPKRFRIN